MKKVYLTLRSTIANETVSPQRQASLEYNRPNESTMIEVHLTGGSSSTPVYHSTGDSSTLPAYHSHVQPSTLWCTPARDKADSQAKASANIGDQATVSPHEATIQQTHLLPRTPSRNCRGDRRQNTN